MAIWDLLWACPTCGEDRAFNPSSPGADARRGGREDEEGVCPGCGTRFFRGTGAEIRASAPDGTETAGSPADWLARLPEAASLLEGDPVRTARVEIRAVTGDARVLGETGYLNRVEIFGDRVPGHIRLERDRLMLEPDRGPEVAARDDHDAEVWPLESLTAVQASSSSLQLKRRGEPLVAFYFRDDAIYLWEQLLRAALRDLYRRTGKGEILEFQPRIVTRKAPGSRG